MSRWIDDFQQHSFQPEWEVLKLEVNEATVDDQTIATNVGELARLKKVVAYIDEILSGIDPELVPASIWVSFGSQITPCLQQVLNYKSNRNIAHIVTANSHVDNLLSYVRPYMIASGKVNKVLQEAVKNYSKTYTEAGIKIKTDVVTLASELKEIVDKNKKRDEYIENTKKAIDDLSDKLFASNDAESSLEAKAESLLLELDEKASKLIEYYKETFVGTADNPPIKKVMADLKDAANSDKESIDKLLGEVENEIEDLHEFYEKVYGKPTTDGGVVGGLENYLSQKKRDLDDFEGKQKIKYKTLNDQIENLLPGATSAGLASAYYDLKKSFDDPIKSATYLFYGALLALVVIAFISTVDNVGRYYINFVDLNNWDVLLRLAYKMPLYLPVLWLGLYASRRRSESQRLQQEYAHKEALAKSYDSYKKQIEALDDKDLVMQKVFIMKAVDAIAYNASNTLDKSHGDKMPAQEILEKILDKTEELIKIKKVLTE